MSYWSHVGIKHANISPHLIHYLLSLKVKEKQPTSLEINLQKNKNHKRSLQIPKAALVRSTKVFIWKDIRYSLKSILYLKSFATKILHQPILCAHRAQKVAHQKNRGENLDSTAAQRKAAGGHDTAKIKRPPLQSLKFFFRPVKAVSLCPVR